MGSAACALDVQGIEFTPVFVTIDPEREQPELRTEFVEALHPRMTGRTGARNAAAEKIGAAGRTPAMLPATVPYAPPCSAWPRRLPSPTHSVEPRLDQDREPCATARGAVRRQFQDPQHKVRKPSGGRRHWHCGHPFLTRAGWRRFQARMPAHCSCLALPLPPAASLTNEARM